MQIDTDLLNSPLVSSLLQLQDTPSAQAPSSPITRALHLTFCGQGPPNWTRPFPRWCSPLFDYSPVDLVASEMSKGKKNNKKDAGRLSDWRSIPLTHMEKNKTEWKFYSKRNWTICILPRVKWTVRDYKTTMKRQKRLLLSKRDFWRKHSVAYFHQDLQLSLFFMSRWFWGLLNFSGTSRAVRIISAVGGSASKARFDEPSFTSFISSAFNYNLQIF